VNGVELPAYRDTGCSYASPRIPHLHQLSVLANLEGKKQRRLQSTKFFCPASWLLNSGKLGYPGRSGT